MSDADDQPTQEHKTVPLMWGDGEDRIEIGEVEVTQDDEGIKVTTTDLNETGEAIFDEYMRDSGSYSIEPEIPLPMFIKDYRELRDGDEPYRHRPMPWTPGLNKIRKEDIKIHEDFQIKLKEENPNAE